MTRLLISILVVLAVSSTAQVDGRRRLLALDHFQSYEKIKTLNDFADWISHMSPADGEALLLNLEPLYNRTTEAVTGILGEVKNLNNSRARTGYLNDAVAEQVLPIVRPVVAYFITTKTGSVVADMLLDAELVDLGKVARAYTLAQLNSSVVHASLSDISVLAKKAFSAVYKEQSLTWGQVTVDVASTLAKLLDNVVSARGKATPFLKKALSDYDVKTFTKVSKVIKSVLASADCATAMDSFVQNIAAIIIAAKGDVSNGLIPNLKTDLKLFGDDMATALFARPATKVLLQALGVTQTLRQLPTIVDDIKNNGSLYALQIVSDGFNLISKDIRYGQLTWGQCAREWAQSFFDAYSVLRSSNIGRRLAMTGAQVLLLPNTTSLVNVTSSMLNSSIKVAELSRDKKKVALSVTVKIRMYKPTTTEMREQIRTQVASIANVPSSSVKLMSTVSLLRSDIDYYDVTIRYAVLGLNGRAAATAAAALQGAPFGQDFTPLWHFLRYVVDGFFGAPTVITTEAKAKWYY